MLKNTRKKYVLFKYLQIRLEEYIKFLQNFWKKLEMS